MQTACYLRRNRALKKIKALYPPIDSTELIDDDDVSYMKRFTIKK